MGQGSGTTLLPTELRELLENWQPHSHSVSESSTPPLDLYLNKWVADFEQRLERTGKGELIQAVCNRVATRLQHRRQRRRRVAAESLPRPSLEFGAGRTAWAQVWTEDSTPEGILWEHWKRRWTRNTGELHSRQDAAPAAQPLFSYDVLT